MKTRKPTIEVEVEVRIASGKPETVQAELALFAESSLESCEIIANTKWEYRKTYRMQGIAVVSMWLVCQTQEIANQITRIVNAIPKGGFNAKRAGTWNIEARTTKQAYSTIALPQYIDKYTYRELTRHA